MATVGIERPSRARQHQLDSLFQPFTLKSLELPNRVAMAPMTRGFSPGGIPGPDVAGYYRRRAEGGVGLIITEGTLISHPSAGPNTTYPRLAPGASQAAWQHVVDEVHGAGGHILSDISAYGTN
jgi:2,4-dienoyl-CoA reductase-like NADH-dependent reductase (Old Yellow Enzyme family)